MRISVNGTVYDELSALDCAKAISIQEGHIVGLSYIPWRKDPWHALVCCNGPRIHTAATKIRALCGLIKNNRGLFGKTIKVIR